MYIPDFFRVEQPEKLTKLIQQNSFATLVTHDGNAPFASHLPVLYRPSAGLHGTLASHVARMNPQWQHFKDGREVLVIFQGPHAYISPSWYKAAQAVPTWNYAAVHAYGIPGIVSDPEAVEALLRETVSNYESGQPKPWPADLTSDYHQKLMQAIVAFEIPVGRMEGKFKLGQNRSPADIRGVFEALSKSTSPLDQAVAKMIREECNVGENVAL